MVNVARILRSSVPLAGLFALSAVGCQNVVEDIPPAPHVNYPQVGVAQVKASSGVPLTPALQDPSVVVTLIHSETTVARSNPFELHPIEKAYETKQQNARVFANTGTFWPAVFTPRPEQVEVIQTEPQPYRRLAGVVVGDSVMAIIDMGNGGPMELIRPGMQIPNSPWRVVSIDEDKAVLKRSGNRLPREIVVRLEPVPAGGAPAIAQPGNQPPAQQPGGRGRAGAGAGRNVGAGAGAGSEE